MGIKTKVKIGEDWVDGEEMQFTMEREDWNIYNLEDGTKIKVKLIPTKIVKTDMRHPVRNDPIYSISSSTIVEAEVLESQKKKIE